MRISALIIAAVALSACAHTRKGPALGPAPKQVTLLFNGRKGEQTTTRYYSNSRTRRYSDGQMTNDRTEIVDFGVQTKTTGIENKVISTVVKTVRKDGTVDLHDLAFPELGEEIEFETRTNGEVLKAGQYPSHSIFFVPSLPIPDKPVEAGDTWTMEHTWYSGHEHIPLKLDVVGILKGIVPCEDGYCADIEVSGSVSLVARPAAAGARFDSRVWGRTLFSLKRGDVIWSEMRSREEMTAQPERTFVESCMISQMQVPSPNNSGSFECDSKEQAVDRIPDL
jgi:hypothetical protein